jgi:integrase
VGLPVALPKFPKLSRAESAGLMKGRPITTEEFERMLEKVEAGLLKVPKPMKPAGTKRRRNDEVVSKHREQRLASVAAASESWRHYLRGLWLSGLRLRESLELTWCDDNKLHLDLTGKNPMMRIPVELEKGNKDRLLPITPDFAAFLIATPEDQRTGYVCNPKPINTINGPGRRVDRVAADRACHIIGKIGEVAGVKVGADARTGKVKYASAHDLRRAFGERWASKLRPTVLRELMRHESIEATLRFYVGRNAQNTAAAVWDTLKAENGQTVNSRVNSRKKSSSFDSIAIDANSSVQ